MDYYGADGYSTVRICCCASRSLHLCIGGGGGALATAEWYSIADNNWEALPNMAINRFGH